MNVTVDSCGMALERLFTLSKVNTQRIKPYKGNSECKLTLAKICLYYTMAQKVHSSVLFLTVQFFFGQSRKFL